VPSLKVAASEFDGDGDCDGGADDGGAVTGEGGGDGDPAPQAATQTITATTAAMTASTLNLLVLSPIIPLQSWKKLVTVRLPASSPPS
jgi:hypothetical protein